MGSYTVDGLGLQIKKIHGKTSTKLFRGRIYLLICFCLSDSSIFSDLLNYEIEIRKDGLCYDAMTSKTYSGIGVCGQADGVLVRPPISINSLPKKPIVARKYYNGIWCGEQYEYDESEALFAMYYFAPNSDFPKKATFFSRGRQIYEMEFDENARQVGVAREWYDDGTLKEIAEYKNGKPDGIGVKFFSNGNLNVVAHFVRDLYDGQFLQWNDGGELLFNIIYKNNVVVKLNYAKYKNVNFAR